MAKARRTPLWSTIAATLRGEIGEGAWPEGARLPTEAELARRFGVNRHTVRQGLAALVEDGLVRRRRGAGAFVTGRPTDYALGRRVRFHQNLTEAGHVPEKRVLSIETRAATRAEAAALELAAGAQVHLYEGLSLSDGRAIAFFRSCFPAGPLPALPERLGREGSVTAALAASGVTDHIRVSSRIEARPASPDKALRLGVSEGTPLLRVTGINIDGNGRPIEYGRTWFIGERVTLTLDHAVP